MAHEADGGLAVVILGGGLGDGRCHPLKVCLVGEQGLADGQVLEGVGVLGRRVHQLFILQAVHQMGGLEDEGLDPVVHRPVQGLPDVVHGHPVPVLHFIQNDLAGKGPADRVVGEGSL